MSLAVSYHSLTLAREKYCPRTVCLLSAQDSSAMPSVSSDPNRYSASSDQQAKQTLKQISNQNTNWPSSTSANQTNKQLQGRIYCGTRRRHRLHTLSCSVGNASKHNNNYPACPVCPVLKGTSYKSSQLAERTCASCWTLLCASQLTLELLAEGSGAPTP